MSIEGRKDNRSFNIPNKKYYTGGVKGNGISLGLSNGTRNFGIHTGDAYYSSGIMFAGTDWYGANKTQSSGAIATGNSGDTSILGITTDTSKSGIIVEPDTQISMIIKY